MALLRAFGGDAASTRRRWGGRRRAGETHHAGVAHAESAPLRLVCGRRGGGGRGTARQPPPHTDPPPAAAANAPNAATPPSPPQLRSRRVSLSVDTLRGEPSLKFEGAELLKFFKICFCLVISALVSFLHPTDCANDQHHAHDAQVASRCGRYSRHTGANAGAGYACPRPRNSVSKRVRVSAAVSAFAWAPH